MSSDDFKTYREAQQERRAKRLPVRQAEIEALVEAGYTVRKLTEFQYRVNDLYDLYPIHRRWHELKTGKRGNYTTGKLAEFIQSKIKL